MLYLGLVIGVMTGNIAARRAGVSTSRVYVATLVLLMVALLGARALHVALHWNLYRHDRRRIWRRAEGGSMMYGGFMAMMLFSIPTLRLLGLRFGAFWDVSVFTILVGMIFTRIGCLLNGCCSGRRTEGWFSISLPNAQGIWEKRIPTQILEALCGFGLLIVSTIVWRKVQFPGQLFLFVTLGYSAARFIMEFSRERKAKIFEVSQAISIMAFLSSALILAFLSR
jgi:prolipoprotein diacylglyceryltransferase